MIRTGLLRRRSTGRDHGGPDRLVTERFTHRIARLREPTTARATTPGAGRTAPLIVGLHGLGADERQFGSLLPLDLPADAHYVGLRAPVPYGDTGFSWYDPTLAAGEIDHGPVVDRVADAVIALRAEVGAAADSTVIIGYSQAASLAVAIGAMRPDLAAGIVLGSAALPPGLIDLGPGRPERAFVAIGNRDPFLDEATVSELVSAWGEPPGRCTVRSFEVPHVMSPAMATEISRWIRDGSAGR